MSLKILLSENFVSLAKVNRVQISSPVSISREAKKNSQAIFSISLTRVVKKNSLMEFFALFSTLADGIFSSVLVVSSALRRVKEFPKLIGYICIKHTLAHSCKHAHLRALAVYIIATDNIFEQK